MSSIFLYHRVPRYGQRGEILYPLNILRDYFPEAYAEHVKKYQNRLYELERGIPPLNCLWNDVLHLSAVHPALIKQAQAQSGYTIPATLSYYQIDPLLLDPQKAVIYLFSKPVPPFERIDSAEFIPYTPEALSAFTQITTLTRKHYEAMVKLGKAPLAYFGVPHILFKGTIDTSNLSIVYS